MAAQKNPEKKADKKLETGREKPGHSVVRNPDPDVYESQLHSADEMDEEYSDVGPIKPPHEGTHARDPELRDDDESPTDTGRVFRREKKTG